MQPAIAMQRVRISSMTHDSATRLFRPSRHPTGDQGTASPPRILIADDEATIVSLLAMLFEDEGFQVLRAYDGEQAWKLTLQYEPHLVITDVYMPKLGGLELVRRFRSVHALARTPVILMSAAIRTEGDDFATFVPKPFDLDALLAVVKSRLLVRAHRLSS